MADLTSSGPAVVPASIIARRPSPSDLAVAPPYPPAYPSAAAPADPPDAAPAEPATAEVAAPKRLSVRARLARANAPAATSPSDALAPRNGSMIGDAGASPAPAVAVPPVAGSEDPPVVAPNAEQGGHDAAISEGSLPAGFGSVEDDGTPSLPALLAASRAAVPNGASSLPLPALLVAASPAATPSTSADAAEADADRLPIADVVRGEVEDDPIDEVPLWADDAIDLVDPDAPVVGPWADREPVADVVAPMAEPSPYRIGTPAPSPQRSRSKAKITPPMGSSLLAADTEAVAVGASPLFWEARPERQAPMLPALRRYVPPTSALPAHHHDFEGVVGDRLEVVESDHEPVAPAVVHSGLLLTAADVDSDNEVLDRGDMGEGRIGQTLEGARVHGIEVIHAHRFGHASVPVDHLVISANGVWVVHAVDVLEGRLERRDVGDWFRKDQRLFIDDAERSDLLEAARSSATTIAEVLVDSPYADLNVHPVLCFGAVQPAWVDEPFRLDGVSVTWRRHLVEPMLTPVLLDVETRAALTHWFAAAAV